MIRIQRIQAFDEPALRPYATLRYQHEHRQQGIFVAEGEKVVRRLIESPLPVLSVLLPEKWVEDYRRLLESRAEDITIYVAPKKLLETLTGFSMYQGVLAVGKVPPPPCLDAILKAGPRPVLLAATDGMSNALNMGALVRNAAAFRAHALLVSERCCSPFIRRAVRASMGAVFRLPILEPPELAGALRGLRAHGLRIVAAHPHADRRTPAQADFTRDCCVVFGSEGEGLSPAVLGLCDDLVAIPMPPEVDSLNVASASAVFLYEAARQRGQLQARAGATDRRAPHSAA